MWEYRIVKSTRDKNPTQKDYREDQQGNSRQLDILILEKPRSGKSKYITVSRSSKKEEGKEDVPPLGKTEISFIYDMLRTLLFALS